MPTTPLPTPTPTPCRRESVMPWSLRAHLNLAAAVSPWLLVAIVGETHLPPPLPIARSAQPSFVVPAFTVHRYLLLSFPSKPNKMFVTLWYENLRFIESRNCACVVRPCGLVVFHVCVFCACVVNCDDSMLLLPVIFFFFLAFWLCDFVTLCLWLSLSCLYR